MVADSSWCELARFNDLTLARAVATSIAAMEFEVRLEPEPAAPYRIEVEVTDWADLRGVLDEIIAEQQEFDRTLAERRVGKHETHLLIVIGLTGAVDLLVMFGLLKL